MTSEQVKDRWLEELEELATFSWKEQKRVFALYLIRALERPMARGIMERELAELVNAKREVLG